MAQLLSNLLTFSCSYFLALISLLITILISVVIINDYDDYDNIDDNDDNDDNDNIDDNDDYDDYDDIYTYDIDDYNIVDINKDYMNISREELDALRKMFDSEEQLLDFLQFCENEKNCQQNNIFENQNEIEKHLPFAELHMYIISNNNPSLLDIIKYAKKEFKKVGFKTKSYFVDGKFIITLPTGTHMCFVFDTKLQYVTHYLESKTGAG